MAQQKDNKREYKHTWGTLVLPSKAFSPHIYVARNGKSWHKAWAMIPDGVVVDGIDLSGCSVDVFVNGAFEMALANSDFASVRIALDSPLLAVRGEGTFRETKRVDASQLLAAVQVAVRAGATFRAHGVEPDRPQTLYVSVPATSVHPYKAIGDGEQIGMLAVVNVPDGVVVDGHDLTGMSFVALLDAIGVDQAREGRLVNIKVDGDASVHVFNRVERGIEGRLDFDVSARELVQAINRAVIARPTYRGHAAEETVEVCLPARLVSIEGNEANVIMPKYAVVGIPGGGMASQGINVSGWQFSVSVDEAMRQAVAAGEEAPVKLETCKPVMLANDIGGQVAAEAQDVARTIERALMFEQGLSKESQDFAEKMERSQKAAECVKDMTASEHDSHVHSFDER